MNIVNIAELLSAYAALMTVTLAVAELMSRSKSKKAEDAIDIYSDYLIVVQRLEYIIESAGSLAKKCSELSVFERESYAKTHIINEDLILSIRKIEKESIKFLGSKSKNRDKTKTVIELSGFMTNTITMVNTFYQAILDNDNISADLIRINYQQIFDFYQDKVNLIEMVRIYFSDNLKKAGETSKIYLIFLAIAEMVFLALCMVL